MKTETLEALLIDRSLGELSPETMELLEAYLRVAPAHAAAAQVWTATIAEIRRVDTEKCDNAPVAQPWRAPRTVPVWLTRSEVLRLAACVAIGLAIGAFARNSNRAPSISPAAVAEVPPTKTVPTPSFWVTTAAREKAEAAAASPTHRLHWDSPVRMPHFTDKP